MTLPRPFNLNSWIEQNAHLLKPPVSNKLLFENTGIIVQVVGGLNQRVDFHDDPAEEFFYQLRGDMVLKIADNGSVYDLPIREGEVFLLPPHIRHSPQRPVPDSVGLVVEGARHAGMMDGFEWFCFQCGALVHRVEVEVQNIVKDLPPLFDAFYADFDKRICRECGTIHPGKTPPENWVTL